MLKQAIHRAGRSYIRTITKSEADAQKPRSLNERPAELAFLFSCIRDFSPKRLLDVGPGQSPLPAVMQNCGCHITAVDNVTDYWPSGMVNRHWHVIDDDIRKPIRVKPGFDMVTCVSVIEHIDDDVAAFESMAKLLNPGGFLLVTCPYNDSNFVPDVYKLSNAAGIKGQMPYKCSSYNRASVDRWSDAANMELVRQEFWKYWTGDVWRQGDEVIPPFSATAAEPHQLSCMAFRLRS